MLSKNAMRDRNKSHPIVIMMRNRSDEMDRLMLEVMKFLITSVAVSGFIGMILFLTLKLESMIYFITLLFNAGVNCLLIRGYMINSYTDEIYRMIYSDEFNTVYVNDEKLLGIIEKINIQKGKIIFTKEKIIFDNILLVVITIFITLIKFLF